VADISDALVKDVYAYFGRAYYFSECLHRELCNADLLSAGPRLYELTRPRAEEMLVIAYSRTLGKALEAVAPLLPEDLYQRLRSGVETRNFLAHRFWFERVHMMSTNDGLELLIIELSEIAEKFQALDAEVTLFFRKQWDELGVTDEVLNKALDAVLAGEDEPLPTQRRPAKREQIVRSWNVPTEDGGTQLILESDDGALWQFSDVGLGWTRAIHPETTWTINTVLQEHLPATVNPRPKDSPPWHYDIVFDSGPVLWVRRGQTPRTFRWGLRTGTESVAK
jgi:hypothetical protein